jgi:hypothetical protein
MLQQEENSSQRLARPAYREVRETSISGGISRPLVTARYELEQLAWLAFILADTFGITSITLSRS